MYAIPPRLENVMGFFGGDDKGKLEFKQGFFESDRAFSERVVKAGNRVAGDKFANAKSTLRKLDEEAKARQKKERDRKAAQAKRDAEGRMSARRLADERRQRRERQKKRNEPNAWWS